MNNHSGALFAWASGNVRNRIVVHLDAHSDFRPIPARKLEESLKLLAADELTQLEQRSDTGREELVNIGNYLYAAAKAGIAREVYWVKTADVTFTPYDLPAVKEWLSSEGYSRNEVETFRLVDGRVSGELSGVPFTICSLATLPPFTEAVLLDIDIDFFPNELMRTPAKSLIDLIARFRKTLEAGPVEYDHVTVASSLDMDFTPMQHYFLAEAMKMLVTDRSMAESEPSWKRLKLYSAADAHYRASDFTNAERTCLTILEEAPEDAFANYLLANIRTSQANYVDALRHAEKALAADPEYFHGLAFLGMRLLEKDRQAGAKLFELALATAPGDQYVGEKLADAYFNAGLYSEALGEYQKVDNGRFAITMYIGDTLMYLDRVEEALRYYHRGLGVLKDSPYPKPTRLSFALLEDYYLNVRKEPEKASRFKAFILPPPQSPEKKNLAIGELREIIAETLKQ